MSSTEILMFDRRAVELATGWTLHHRAHVDSTNDEAARLRDAGAGPRVAVAADAQHHGRGRAGRTFLSPLGGLYVSMLLAAAEDDLPGPLTAAVTLAAAEAVELTTGVRCGIKWPNDLWVERRKVAGILLEAAGPQLPVVAGLGMNLREVPRALPADIRAATTALDEEAGRPVERESLLEALLPLLDRRTADLRFAARRAALGDAWREQLLFLDEQILYDHGGQRRRAVLLDASLTDGLLLDDESDGIVRRRAEHIREIRPA